MLVSMKRAAELLNADVAMTDEHNVATGISYDTRTLKKGDIFVALRGEEADGSDYLSEADKKGAAFFVINKSETMKCQGVENRVLFVDDSCEAFGKLALWWRAQVNPSIIGVTGSAGKTTVKNMIAQILSEDSQGTFSARSHNNHIGVPYTICRIRKDDKWAVIEMGMNHRGEIQKLTGLVQPNVAVITGVEPAHIGLLGSLENIAAAKLEIVNGMAVYSPLIIPVGNSALENVIEAKNISEKYAIYTFGATSGADCFVYDFKQDGLEGIKFGMNICGEEICVQMGVLGRHNMLNAACAALACKKLLPGISISAIRDGLKAFISPDMRLNLKYIAPNKTIIDDAYNANPASMRAAIDVLNGIKRGAPTKIGLVLGDMRELGEFSSKYHKEIGELVADLAPDFLVTVGKEARVIGKIVASRNILTFIAAESSQVGIIEFIESRPYDVLLVKGSRGVYLEKVTNHLLAAALKPSL